MELRQITIEEWEEYEWIRVDEAGAEYPIYIRGLKKTPLPEYPNDGMMYSTADITKYDDTERKYKVVPLMTYAEKGE